MTAVSPSLVLHQSLSMLGGFMVQFTSCREWQTSAAFLDWQEGRDALKNGHFECKASGTEPFL